MTFNRKILYLGIDPFFYRSNKNVIHYPVIDIQPCLLNDENVHKALDCFWEYTHIIITSKSSIPILCHFLESRNIPLSEWQKKQTIAVGKVTAHHLNKQGIQPSIVAETETAEGIVEELQKIDLTDAFFFWPHSSLARPVLEKFFLLQSIRFISCPLYHTVVRKEEPKPDLTSFEEIIFTSPSTVDAFLTIFGKFPEHCLLTPIGPITQKYLENQCLTHGTIPLQREFLSTQDGLKKDLMQN